MDERPSRTAARVAIRRAIHQIVDRPLVFEDRFALAILGTDRAREVREHPERFTRGHAGRLLRAFLVARSRLAEDLLAAAYQAGVRQYVILGAGLDTFAWRNPYADLRVFEVDHPATQHWKRGRAAVAGLPEPGSQLWVPVDFRTQVLATRLAEAGLTPAPAFFAWLGVAPYLEAEQVFATLSAIRPWATRPGGVVFDYGYARSMLSLWKRFAARRFAARVARIGEPFLSAFRPDDLERRLRECGYEQIEHFPPGALNARFFANRLDRLKVGTLGAMVAAH